VSPVRNWEREYEDRAPFVNQGVIDNAEAEEAREDAEPRQAMHESLALDLDVWDEDEEGGAP
jgi:hypothetical protein